MSKTTYLLALLAGALLMGCQPGPQPLQYGVHECDHCRMTLMDERYGGEIVTTTGKVYTFDSVECLATYLETDAIQKDDVRGLYVVDFGHPGSLVETDAAVFLKSPQLTSPMGANITAFARDQDAQGAKNVFGGRVISWPQAREIVRTGWRDPANPASGHGGM